MANRSAQSEYGKPSHFTLFQHFHNLQRICTHPRVLRYYSEHYKHKFMQKKESLASSEYKGEGSLKDSIDDVDDDLDLQNGTSDSTSSLSSLNDSSVQSVHSDEPSNSQKQPQLRRTRATVKDCKYFTNMERFFSIKFELRNNCTKRDKKLLNIENTVDTEPIKPTKEQNPTEWWMSLCPEDELNNMEYSGKLILLFSILAECEACGDKLVVFSQSLFSLDVVEHFLCMIDKNTQTPNPDAKLGGFTGNWRLGKDYFRMNGNTPILKRDGNCTTFNSAENPEARSATAFLSC